MSGIGGVVNLRNVSRNSLEKRISRNSRTAVDKEEDQDEDAGLRHSGDFKERQVGRPIPSTLLFTI